MLKDLRLSTRVQLAGGPHFSNAVLGIFVPHQFTSATNLLPLYLLTNTRQHPCILHALERVTFVIEM
jgi:hypothetical protein